MPELATVAQALAHARLIGVEQLDAHLLLAQQLGRPRTWLLAHDDAPVADSPALLALLGRRAAGEPLAYLIGKREFHGLLIHVTPDVLVPRPDTETLVDWALELIADHHAPSIVDLGTGSGAIALALKKACPRAQVHASDASQGALAIAQGNGERLGLPVTWYLGDWWQALDPALRFDLAVANPPYVAPGDPHLAALRHEPASALVAPGYGLSCLVRVIAGARDRLQPGGWIVLEHGFSQAGDVRRLLAQAGFETVSTRHDLGGNARVSVGRVVIKGA